jgi:hypothetical protein
MSDETVLSLANQILNTTNAGKLAWKLVPNSASEEFRADIGGGQSITVKRTTQGDDKQIELELSNESGVILRGRADNFISAPTGIAFAALSLGVTRDLITSNSVSPDLPRFNLFSDVFLAARRYATGQDSALAKFKSTLDAKLKPDAEMAVQVVAATSSGSESSNAA